MKKADIMPLLTQTWNEFSEDDAMGLGAALSYYATFSIFPLLLLLLAALGFVLNTWDQAIDARAEILSRISATFSPSLAQTLDQVLKVVQEGAGTATGVGLVTLLVGASGVFRQLELSFNRIWDVPMDATKSYFQTITGMATQWVTSFGMVLALGFLLLISLAVTGVTSILLSEFAHVPVIGGLVGYIFGYIVTLLINTLIFALMFRYLPRTSIRWGDVWLGALLTAIIWELAKRGLALYIGSSSYASAYGVVGAMLVLMTWIYFSSLVLFLGAEFTQVYTQQLGSRKRVETTEFHETYPPPVLVRAPAPAATSAKVGTATGTGLVVGAIGGVLAAAAMLVVGTRRALTFKSKR